MFYQKKQSLQLQILLLQLQKYLYYYFHFLAFQMCLRLLLSLIVMICKGAAHKAKLNDKTSISPAFTIAGFQYALSGTD